MKPVGISQKTHPISGVAPMWSNLATHLSAGLSRHSALRDGGSLGGGGSLHHSIKKVGSILEKTPSNEL